MMDWFVEKARHICVLFSLMFQARETTHDEITTSVLETLDLTSF
jgi:hypothetical protein